MEIITRFEQYRESALNNRFFKHADLQNLLKKLNPEIFHLREVGQSVEGRSISLVKVGTGKKRIFLWSQMHGDEPTATMALFDFFNFLVADDEFNPLRQAILENCTLYILPMVNPDGAEIFTRRNAQGIDINRDFKHQQSPEGRLLRKLRDEIQPEFGFNLHDQGPVWSAGKSGLPATISLLAPPFDEAVSVNPVRQKAMQVISYTYKKLQQVLPNHTARFSDEYESRAFGDNFQAAGTSTILIEAGSYAHDPEKQHIRKFIFRAILSGLECIANNTYQQETEADYSIIPQNDKRHFHILIKNAQINLGTISYQSDIGLIALQELNNDRRSVSYTYLVEDLGDLENYFGYETLDASSYKFILTRPLEHQQPADFILQDGFSTILSIENGRITNKNF
ncbi:MAG TPA: M14 family zinc carboxypeptidase [Daejeonella sp.]|nr:M14 family zinc carboxypeptidase [Daejeonella sp.]